jgi:hypothetical protein
MNMKAKTTLAAAMISILSFVATSYAEPLLGTNYIGVSVGIVQFGDDAIDEVFGNGYGITGAANINVHSNIDIFLTVGGVWADGEVGELGAEVDLSSTGGGVDIVYFFKPDADVNPYVSINFAVVKSEVETSAGGFNGSTDDTGTGYGAEGGFEMQSAEDVLFRLGLYYSTYESEASYGLDVSVGYWFNEKFMMALMGSYDLDSEDAVAELAFITKI